MGDLAAARTELEALLPIWSRSQRTHSIYLAYDRHYRAGIALARTLWLQGYPVQAVERAERPSRMPNRGAIPHRCRGLGVGDLGVSLDRRSRERRHLHRPPDPHAEIHSLGPYRRRRTGLQSGAVDLPRRRQKRRCTPARRTGRNPRHALRVDDHDLRHLACPRTGGDRSAGRRPRPDQPDDRDGRGQRRLSQMPELLRVKASLLLAMPQPNVADAETCLAQSLELSRRQGARAWELRTASDLARLLADRGGATAPASFCSRCSRSSPRASIRSI